jgi:hypothetical protein
MPIVSMIDDPKSKMPYSGICNLTTTFFTPLTSGRPGFGLVLVQVDRNVEMVDQYKEGGRRWRSRWNDRRCPRRIGNFFLISTF